MSDDPRHALGDAGEEAAARHLEAEGWTVLERNWRCRRGELDLIVERGETIAFVEVRTRRSGETRPELSVSRRKQMKLTRAARQWMGGQALARRVFRFDVIAITLEPPRLEHFPSAFIARELDG